MGANIVRSTSNQQHSYNWNHREAFTIAQQVLLRNPTTQKLGPRWTGRWTVTEINSPVNIAITREDTARVVHVNRIHPFLEVQDGSNGQTTSWYTALLCLKVFSTSHSICIHGLMGSFTSVKG